MDHLNNEKQSWFNWVLPYWACLVWAFSQLGRCVLVRNWICLWSNFNVNSPTLPVSSTLHPRQEGWLVKSRRNRVNNREKRVRPITNVDEISHQRRGVATQVGMRKWKTCYYYTWFLNFLWLSNVHLLLLSIIISPLNKNQKTKGICPKNNVFYK